MMCEGKTAVFERVSSAKRMCGVSLLATMAVVAAAGCADRPPSERRLALEVGRAQVYRHVVVVRPGETAHRRFLGSGWGGMDFSSASGERFAWVVGRVASLEIDHAGLEPATIYVRGWPFYVDEMPLQRLTVVVNGVETAPMALSQDGFAVSVTLPEGVVRTGANRVDLGFDYAEAPAVWRAGSKDHRPLAAAITEVALVSGNADPSSPLSGDVFSDEGDLVVEAGTVAVFRIQVPERAAFVAQRLAISEGGPFSDGRAWILPREDSDPIELVARDGRQIVRLENFSGTVVGLAMDGGEHGTRWRRPAIWTPAEVGRIPNVVLIVVDTLRADHVGAYGGAVATPSMDRLAAQGVLFERTWSHIPITGPSHSSLFSGRLPFEHGVHNNSQILPDSAFTLAESMAASGRVTGAVVSLGTLKSAFGLGQGFEYYGDRFVRDWMKDAAEVNREAFNWLETVGDAPYFLFVHYSDPHEPYTPPTRTYPKILVRSRGKVVGELRADGRGWRLPLMLEPGATVIRFELDGEPPEFGFRFPSIQVNDPNIELERLWGWRKWGKGSGGRGLDSSLPATVRLVNRDAEPRSVELSLSCRERFRIATTRERYAEEVAYVDGRIGELLAELERRGDLERSLVVLTADHGEGLGDHKHVGHISQLYDSLIRVPLVLSMPGRLPQGHRIANPAALVDVFPTIAELVGVDPPTDPSGVSLVPVIRGDAPARLIVAETYRPESPTDKRALVDGGSKYIRSATDERSWEELYDLRSDPGEVENLAESDPERVETLARQLDVILGGTGADGHVVPLEASLTEEEKAQLRALGYLRD